jgi:hypothetical protein
MSDNKDKLVVVWTSGDREVALKMVFMYTLNAKLRGWFKDVTLVVWGPSTKLLSEDEDMQTYIGTIKDSGVELLACRACTDEYGVTEALEKLGIEVIYMGEPLTSYLKDDIKIITF